MRKFLAVLFGVVALPLLAQQSAMDQGKAAMARNDGQAAAGFFEKAVAQNPKSAEAHYMLGAAYGVQAQKAGMFGMASLAMKTKTEFETAVQLDPNQLDARFGLVQFYVMAPGFIGGSYDKALEQAAELRKRDPFRGHRAYAFVYQAQKKPELAKKEYLDLLREQPKSGKAHVMYGAYVIGAEKNFAAAANEFETAVKVEPNYMPGWFYLGRATLGTSSNYARGEEALRKYLAYTPTDEEPSLARAHYWLGMIQEKTGRKAEAKASYAASLKLNPDAKDVTEAFKRVQ